MATLLAGCVAMGPATAPVVKDGVFIDNVPFYSQTTNMCGPAALASVMNLHGAAIPFEEIERGVFSKKLGGTLLMDMLLFARERGLCAEHYAGSIADLKRKLVAGRPLILFIKTGAGRLSMGHYVVVVGYDDARGVVYAHSGGRRAVPMSYGLLDVAWARTGFAALLITPPVGGEGNGSTGAGKGQSCSSSME